MQDLATLEDFAADQAPHQAREERLGFNLAIVMVVLLLGALGLDWKATGFEFWQGVLTTVVIGVPFGILCALFARFMDRYEYERKVQRRLERILQADPGIVPPGPVDSTHRLACGLLLSRRRACGGMLYVGRDRLTFQPNYPARRFWHWKKPEPPAPLYIGPPRTIVLSSGVLRPGNLLVRALGRLPVQVMLCQWESGAVVLRVPLTQVIVERLQRCVDALRSSGAEADD